MAVNSKQNVILTITNHADGITGTIPTAKYLVYVKESTSATDYPDLTDTYYYGEMSGNTIIIVPKKLKEVAGNINVRVVSVSETGQLGNYWQGTIEGGLYRTIDEQLESDTTMTVKPADIVKMLNGFISGQSNAISDKVKNYATEQAKDVCCTCNNTTTTCTSSSTSEVTESALFADQHFINLFYKGKVISGKNIFTTELGSRYGINLNQLRLSNENVGTGDAMLKVESSNYAQLALPTGDYAIDNPYFGAIVKTSSGSLAINCVHDGLRDARIRFGFKLNSFGSFIDTGESIATYYETLFQHHGALTPNFLIEAEEGYDYGSTFSVSDFDVLVQQPPVGGDLTVRVGTDKTMTSNYIDISILDGTQSGYDFVQTLQVTNPKELYMKVIGNPHGAGYIELHCKITTQTTTTGTYPYDYRPHFDTYFYDGIASSATYRHVRRFKEAMVNVWNEIHLQDAATTDTVFRVKGVVSGEYMDITVLTGQRRGSMSGLINISASDSLEIEVLSGTAEYFMLLYEVHQA